MKSKAQRYAESRLEWLTFDVGDLKNIAQVNDAGNLYFRGLILSQQQALQFRDWLTDTFDVPKQTHYPLIGRD